jgi:hypothetical protein
MPGLASLDICTEPREMLVPEDPCVEPAFLDLPATPGVAIFLSRHADGDAGAAPILIAATGDLRDLARRRICPESVEPAPAPVTDEGRPAFKRPMAPAPRVAYRAIVSRIMALPAGSALEADAIYLREARERMPKVYQAVSERWRAWFAHVDPDTEFPIWSKTNLLVGLVGKRSASTLISGSSLPPGVLLGPLPDKDAAGRFIERMIDAFDLCRYPHLLVQAPKALACAYKEMGRCPAPCDGSEVFARYRERTRACIELIGAGRLADEVGVAEAAMRTAAADGAFEIAAAQKNRLDRFRSLEATAFANVTSLAEWRMLVLLRSTQTGQIRAALFDRGELIRLGDSDARDAARTKQAATEVSAWLNTALQQPEAQSPLSLDTPRVDTIGLFSRWLFQPAKRRIGEALAIDLSAPSLGLDTAAIAAAIKRVLSPKRAASEDVQESELESPPASS